MPEYCQHDVEYIKECEECEKLPFCQRVYTDTGKNNCYFQKPFLKSKSKLCIYCGRKEPKYLKL